MTLVSLTSIHAAFPIKTLVTNLQKIIVQFHILMAVQSQKMVINLKFQINETEGLCYLFTESKVQDSCAVTDLRLCYRNTKSCFSHDGAEIFFFKIKQNRYLQSSICFERRK